MGESKGVSQDKVRLHLQRPEGKISRRELLKLASPLGKVTLDGSKCTGCGLCVAECTTQALTFSSKEGTDVYQLLFKHDLCIACGQCVEVCPEQCLHLERTLELDRISGPATVLFENEIVRCSRCGSPVASGAMIGKLRARLQSMGESFTSQLELCPVCKAEARFVTGVSTPEPVTEPEQNLINSAGSR
ncbi:4Fe-4S dicluster domain-containing protein [Chloroflexota bacterium]